MLRVVHKLLPKTAQNVALLITSDAPVTTGITCVSMAIFFSSLLPPQSFRPEGEIPGRHSSNSRVY